jgi:hypothetical protein
MSTATSTWHVKGDWFDVCSCILPCGCTFAQAPTDDRCSGILAWNITEGHLDDVDLTDFTVVTVGEIQGGNLWDPDVVATGSFTLLIDERADEAQRDALVRIWSGKEGGWAAQFASVLGELKGVEYVPVRFEIAADLEHWSVEVPGRVRAAAKALTGPTTPEGKRVQTHNPPGSETGGSPATWAVPTDDFHTGFPLTLEWKGRSSKHIPFDWHSDPA